MLMIKREKWLIYDLMILVMLVTVAPLIWMITTSFKTQTESIAFLSILLPTNPGFQAYGKIPHGMSFDSFYFNSIVSTLVIVILQTLTTAMTVYGFPQLRFKGRDVLFMLRISTLTVPSQVLLIPQFLIAGRIGLLNSIPGLVLPGLFSIHSAFLLRQLLLSIPKELEEAAIMDGYNHLTILFKIMLSLIKLGPIACVITSGLWSQNNLMWPLVINASMDKTTLPVGLASLSGCPSAECPMLMTGALLATIPMLLPYISFQRYSIRGIAGAGIKG